MTKNQDVYNNLITVLATGYSLYIHTQNFHWNLVGHSFYMLHKFSEALYRGLAENIDQIAERIRILGYNTPASFSAFQSLTKIHEPFHLGRNEKEAITELLSNWLVFVDVINKAIKEIKKTDDEGTLTLLTDLIQEQEKNSWLIKNHLGT